MVYECKCDKCGNITVVDTDITKIGPNYDTYVTAYGYLSTTCHHCGEHEAYATWRGRDGDMFPRTGVFV